MPHNPSSAVTNEAVGTTNQDRKVRAAWAVELINKHIQFLPHPKGHVVRLTQFAHDSAGLRQYKREICEALVYLVESNGGHVLNGLSDAVTLLQGAGYTVIPPRQSV